MIINIFRNKFFAIFCLLIVLNIASTNGQSKRELFNYKTRANENFKSYRYHLALPDFLTLDSIDGAENTYIYPIAVCYMMQDNSSEALPYFKECLKTADKYPLDLFYYAGKTLHLEHEFEEAIVNFDIYNSLMLQKKKKNFKTIAKIYREIEMCRNGKDYTSHPASIKIENLGMQINTKYPEYAPVVTADEKKIIYTSNRPHSTFNPKVQSDGHYMEDIYVSEKDENNQWQLSQILPSGVNSVGNDASISITPDGHKLLIYRATQDYWIKSSSGDLYTVELKGDQWSEPLPLPEVINSSSWESSACFSANEKLLLFTSNRPGGMGGTDIYISAKLPGGQWDTPKNFSSKINTSFDEDSPYLHPDGKSLYFSSNGHKSMGGFDIFVSTYDDIKKEWNEPVNLGYPINSAHDDIYFSLSADGKRIYFSSIRPESHGNRDLYCAHFNETPASLMVVSGVIRDSLTQQPLEAIIKLIDKSTNQLLGVFNSNSSTGKYLLVLPEGKNYHVVIESEFHELCDEYFDISKISSFEEVKKNIVLCQKK